MHAHVIRKLPFLSILLLAVIANGIGHSHKLAQEAVFMQKSVKNCDEKMFSKPVSTNTDAKMRRKGQDKSHHGTATWKVTLKKVC